MMKLCLKCLDDLTEVHQHGKIDGRTYTMYRCKHCLKITRVFDVPVTEHEVVLVALVEDALSARVPKREAAVEQLLMFPRVRVWD